MNYLEDQLITYLGNKRALLPLIEQGLSQIEKEIKIETIADVFSGSGVVSRLFKSKGYNVISNDLEDYATIISKCYLSNANLLNKDKWNKYKNEMDLIPKSKGIISNNYAPQDTNNIKKDERVFYSQENAQILDTYRNEIDKLPINLQKYFLAPLLSEMSIHVNTAGVFKGFYKDRNTGIGKFGGTKGNALSRILGEITLNCPVLSKNITGYQVYQEDAKTFASKIIADVAYLDPPYNQHPYGSNYFLLNVFLKNKLPEKISKVAGIDAAWNRSNYNKKAEIGKELESLINNLQVPYILLSYNSEGFLNYEEIIELLEKYGEVSVMSTEYPTFRGCRNLQNRNICVTEYLFLLKKKEVIIDETIKQGQDYLFKIQVDDATIESPHHEGVVRFIDEDILTKENIIRWINNNSDEYYCKLSLENTAIIWYHKD